MKSAIVLLVVIAAALAAGVSYDHYHPCLRFTQRSELIHDGYPDGRKQAETWVCEERR